jgi:iron complex outermembrane receptor protein
MRRGIGRRAHAGCTFFATVALRQLLGVDSKRLNRSAIVVFSQRTEIRGSIVKTATPLARAIRIAIGSAAGITAALASTVALPQEALDEVVITGSRIRQNPLEERLPVLSVGIEDYQASGATSIADFVQKLPIAGSAINRTNNSSGNLGYPPDGGGIGAGAAEIDLRYLASKRVLVLVDGRRWVKGSSGSGISGAVDLNSIPANAIKSIEILQDGASAIYGSDAIGGVMNIITADDYDTFKVSGYTGQYGDGDGETAEFDVRMGASGERGRGLLDISYTNQKAVNTADRSTSEFPIPGFPFGVSSGSPAGRFIFFDPVVGDFVSIAPDTAADPSYALGNGDDDFHDFALEDRFNYQPFNHLVTPNERFNLFAKGEYDITDNVRFRTLASFTNRKSQGRAAPVPLFFGAGGGSTFYMANFLWPANHPYNPFGIDLFGSTDPTVDPETPGYVDTIGRRPIEAGPRIFNQDVDTWYLSGGFEGDFEVGSRTMYWDVTGIRAENNARQTKLNQFNARLINLALGDPAVCAATAGCVPLNIVGEGSMTPEMLDFVTYTGVDTSNQKLVDVTANLSGDLVELPAGALGFAVGYEHREEDGQYIPDPVLVAGETADVPTSPTAGGYDVDEFYGEVVVPLVKDRVAFDSLSLSAAARYSDSDLFDSETGTKFSVNWGPTENLMLRASYAEGFRAPNIGELFNQGARFDSSITDQCNTDVNPTPPANCAALGVPDDYVQINPQISVDTGGNRELQPETSETFTAGFTWQMPLSGAFENLLIEGNYYDISIDNAIQAPDGQDLLDACIETANPLICGQVNRLPSGTITSIEGQLQNIGGIETNGVDVNFDLALAESGIGQFRFQLMASFLLDYDELFPDLVNGGFNRVERAGLELGSPTRGFVEQKATLNTYWDYGDFSALLSLRYLSELTEQCVGLVADFVLTVDSCDGPIIDPPPTGPDPEDDPPPFRAINSLDSQLYVDLQFGWAPEDLFGGGWSFAVGVQNLTDEEPPICFSCDLNSLDGTIYPIAGQFWYLRASFTN